MIDHAQATAIAEKHLIRLSEEMGVDLSLDLDATCETPEGWLIFWNSTSYLSNGAISDALAGNGPLLVARENGSVERLPVDYVASGLGEPGN